MIKMYTVLVIFSRPLSPLEQFHRHIQRGRVPRPLTIVGYWGNGK